MNTGKKKKKREGGEEEDAPFFPLVSLNVTRLLTSPNTFVATILCTFLAYASGLNNSSRVPCETIVSCARGSGKLPNMVWGVAIASCIVRL